MSGRLRRTTHVFLTLTLLGTVLAATDALATPQRMIEANPGPRTPAATPLGLLQRLGMVSGDRRPADIGLSGHEPDESRSRSLEHAGRTVQETIAYDYEGDGIGNFIRQIRETYDVHGNRIRWEVLDDIGGDGVLDVGDIRTYAYDARGHVVHELREVDGGVDGTIEYSETLTTLAMDHHGNPTRQVRQSSLGVVLRTLEMAYDERGRLVFRQDDEDYSGDGVVDLRTVEEYTRNGPGTVEHVAGTQDYGVDGIVDYRYAWVSRHDSRGNVMGGEGETVAADGTLYSWFRATLDHSRHGHPVSYSFEAGQVPGVVDYLVSLTTLERDHDDNPTRQLLEESYRWDPAPAVSAYWEKSYDVHNRLVSWRVPGVPPAGDYEIHTYTYQGPPRGLKGPGLAALQEPAVEAPVVGLRVSGVNPFRDDTRVTFALPAAAHAELHVFDASGRHVRTLADDRFPAGEHSVAWDGMDHSGSPVPSGAYFIRARAGEEVAVTTLIRAR